MFLGHFALGFGAKAVEPRFSLGTAFLGAQFVDLLWPTLLLLNLERVQIEPGITDVTPLNFVHYPISHSLLMACLWGLLLGLVYWWARKNTRGALLLGALVVSHWVLDLIVHRPDLPLFPGPSPLLGLGLWNSLVGTLLVESAIFAVGFAVYLRVTRAKDRSGVYGLWALAGFLVLVYLGNLFGPPPDSTASIAVVGHLQWALVGWAYWLDRHRASVGSDARDLHSAT